jgi:hypothetical protein
MKFLVCFCFALFVFCFFCWFICFFFVESIFVFSYLVDIGKRTLAQIVNGSFEPTKAQNPLQPPREHPKRKLKHLGISRSFWKKKSGANLGSVHEELVSNVIEYGNWLQTEVKNLIK